MACAAIKRGLDPVDKKLEVRIQEIRYERSKVLGAVVM